MQFLTPYDSGVPTGNLIGYAENLDCPFVFLSRKGRVLYRVFVGDQQQIPPCIALVTAYDCGCDLAGYECDRCNVALVEMVEMVRQEVRGRQK